MVSDTGSPLICDFGCARMADASQSFANFTSGIKGTQRYLAYELLVALSLSTEGSSGHTPKTDVWAFGMTVFVSRNAEFFPSRIVYLYVRKELCTRERPYSNFREMQVTHAIWNHELPQFPTSPSSNISSEALRELETLCHGCWKHDPAERSSMPLILRGLKRVKDLNETSVMASSPDLVRGRIGQVF